jgi:hypothetical protein
MAAAKKGHHTTLFVVLGLAAAAGGAYWYYQDKKKSQQAPGSASSSALSSTQVQGISPVEQPNSFASTPTIQNFVSNTTSQSTSVFAPVTAFHVKPFHVPFPIHPPHGPWRPPIPHRR